LPFSISESADARANAAEAAFLMLNTDCAVLEPMVNDD
jgi:hypothetical protein